METAKKNYYGSLCTQMYEILHEQAPSDELDFYLSYAEKDMSILEPLCGSGRFLVEFLKRGFRIKGVDNSQEMLEKLLEKAPDAVVTASDIETFESAEQFDYIFISSGSVSLFTDMSCCKRILSNMKALLKEGGKFVFAVDSAALRCPESDAYQTQVTVTPRENCRLILRSKSHYDEVTHTQFNPALYELYENDKLVQQEEMDFQTHLYELGEMEEILTEIGFSNIRVYSSFSKEIAKTDDSEIFLYECSY
ncbi:class I SAM-dependent methyltransferase [Feifania hominis]|uniref:Class I SAM-dependent methyltransferase n=1 Tax=Feifania hominis TaxID=2763660 RepID=A0A926HU22_9FIRM|nr:class I SAM-dependent methyltransferase [Feifania hominis]MBC8535490.1 class I SAM-dependent methyltransferase [Feifania hominis]